LVATSHNFQSIMIITFPTDSLIATHRISSLHWAPINQ
jgi:hypothetical protein